MFQQEAHVEEALRSLLGQTFRDVGFVLVDDASRDGTVDAARRAVAGDPRVVLLRNEKRLGMARNWRRAFEVARERFPSARFFAWGSDHDRWDPGWLAALVAALEANLAAVLAYPHFVRITETGEECRRRRLATFGTDGVRDPKRRFAATLIRAPAGSLVYGLFRADALARAGVFRDVIAADRLLLLELSLQGEFLQLPDVLWWRRFRFRVSGGRQRSAFFPAGPPARSYLPWWIQQPAVIFWRLGVRGEAPPAIGRRLALWAALAYLPLAATRALWRTSRKIRKWSRRAWLLFRAGLRRGGTALRRAR